MKNPCKCITLRRIYKIIFMTSLKNVILDLGGVIVKLDQKVVIKAIANYIGIENVQAFQTEDFQLLLLQYERGKCSDSEFLVQLQQCFINWNACHSTYAHSHFTPITENSLLGSVPSLEEIKHIWNSMILDMPLSALKCLKELKQKYRLFLLSNTNGLHIECVRNKVKQEYAGLEFDTLFHRAYYSHCMGVNKPDPEIFRMVLQNENLCPEETLFVDDTKENVLAAKQLGLQTHHLVDENLANFFLEKK